ncbi:putative Kinase protein with adenine nucleotide alpha hydrolases-like domain [Hibiscus syriacus]|uniref:Kinase protein with adenine nucleotide alpha hydrolases-like domain n=1 Tax=Hibiscus syriacus TaxID=106335 RepID=A0A6A3C7F8_HIBSY|nr:putative Kinase protein with adenine nucleotide alpha hydrolases-like domain [Hibiscus syriacus]
MQNLISVGARKFGIIGVPPVGCCPSQRLSANGECVKDLNDQAEAFFSTMNTLMRNLSSENKDIKYSLGNAYAITRKVIDNPQKFNFIDVKNACCGNGALNAESFALAQLSFARIVKTCSGISTPQAASKMVAFKLYTGEPEYASPINFSQLAEAY